MNRAWLALFGLWLSLLSGSFARWMGENSPGLVQALHLNSLLNTRTTQLQSLQTDLARLTSEAEQLEKSRATQQREIRRVLGYAAADEIIFDFATPDTI